MKIYWSGDAKNIIGPRVKELREKAGLSQEALVNMPIVSECHILLSSTVFLTQPKELPSPLDLSSNFHNI